MQAQDFVFDLPENLIAQKPANPRDACRLMCLDKTEQTIVNRHFFDLEQLLNPGDVLVFNDSKVIPARILFQIGSKKVELFLVRKVSENQWLALGKPGKVLAVGKKFVLSEQLQFEVLEILEDGLRKVQFSLSGLELEKALNAIGAPPFPPYIKTPQASFDDYQTVYARDAGSVAAPTAGLHFTVELLDKLKQKGVQLEFVTLHVGMGTFQPVKVDKIEEHQMHSEFYQLQEDVAERLMTAKKAGRRIIAVGTTAVRVLESASESGSLVAGFGETAIFIYPGYKWRFVDGIITNFHLPKSTLLMLVSAFAGREFVLKAYEKAVKDGYRFYSFGDAMFLSG